MKFFMTDYERLMERLREGESIDAIGNEFAEMLTRASKQHHDEVEAEKARQAEEEQRLARENENAEIRKMLAEDLANAFQAYIDFVAPDLVSEDDKVSAEEVMETIDNIADVWRAFKPVSQKAKVIVRKLDRTADDIIADFLSRCGW